MKKTRKLNLRTEMVRLLNEPEISGARGYGRPTFLTCDPATCPLPTDSCP